MMGAWIPRAFAHFLRRSAIVASPQKPACQQTTMSAFNESLVNEAALILAIFIIII